MSISGVGKVYQDIQKIRIALSNKTWAAEAGRSQSVPKVFETMIEQLKGMEDQLIKAAKDELKYHPVWPWLSEIKGMGPALAAQLLGYIQDIRRFPNPSKLWKFCGLGVKNSRNASAVVQDILITAKRAGEEGNRIKIQFRQFEYDNPEIEVRNNLVIVYIGEKTTRDEVVETINSDSSLEMPVYADLVGEANEIVKPTSQIQLEGGQYGLAERMAKGEKAGYNPRLKSLLYKIGCSFIKTNSPYRAVYDDTKRRYEEARPDWSRKRIHLTAMRKMEKVFLANLWEAWRQAEGLPTRVKEYPFDQLNHPIEERFSYKEFVS